MAEELPEDLRQRADEVLAQPKFRPEEPGLVDRAIDWVSDLIGDLLSVVTGGSSFGGVAIGWIVLAAMVGLIIYFLARFMPRLSSVKEAKTPAQVSTVSSRRTRREWLDEAVAADAAGHHREAVRARYRATVAGLVDSEELPDTPGATTAELQTEFDAVPARSDPFDSSSDAFSDVWYGGAEAERSDSEQLAAWDAQVLAKTSDQ